MKFKEMYTDDSIRKLGCRSKVVVITIFLTSVALMFFMLYRDLVEAIEGKSKLSFPDDVIYVFVAYLIFVVLYDMHIKKKYIKCMEEKAMAEGKFIIAFDNSVYIVHEVKEENIDLKSRGDGIVSNQHAFWYLITVNGHDVWVDKNDCYSVDLGNMKQIVKLNI